MFIRRTSLIIPTRNRFNNLNNLFTTINYNLKEFNEILIIDSSETLIHKKIKQNFQKYKNTKVIKSKASTSLQRNIGLKKYNKKNKYVMFCDDDVIFGKKAFKTMNKFIKIRPNSVGYGFNLIEKKKISFLDNIKKNNFLTQYGLYSKKPGIVCQNGWHTKLSNIKKDCDTMWLSTQACIYRSNIIKKGIMFNEKLGRYSYLEDLFFSFSISKLGKLSISKKSTYKHPNNFQRNDFKFGVKEVINRFKFVNKFKLNKNKFLITFCLKILFNFIMIIFFRYYLIPKCLGNLIGLILCKTQK